MSSNFGREMSCDELYDLRGKTTAGQPRSVQERDEGGISLMQSAEEIRIRTLSCLYISESSRIAHRVVESYYRAVNCA